MGKVLIFDDDKDILELCSLILSRRGFVTSGETSCKDVIHKIQEVKPDVILMDNWIPDIGGIQATKLIKRNPATQDIPVIFFTANNNVENLSHEAGADYFLQKPFDIVQFEGLVRQAINARLEERRELL